MVESWMRRRRNNRPAGTTLAAKESLPAMESTLRLVAVQRRSQAVISVCRGTSLSVGKRSCCRWESMRIPRKVRVVVGPSVLSCATGKTSRLHARRNSLMCSWQRGEPAGAVKK